MQHPFILKSSTCVAARGAVCSGFLWLLLIVFSGVAQADESPSAVAVSAMTLTSGCADCHGIDGLARENLDAPIIAGMPASQIEEAIYAYRDGARQCRYEPLMCETVLHTSTSVLRTSPSTMPVSVAAPPTNLTTSNLQSEARKFTTGFAGSCHVKPEDPRVADALGIPLHGQRGVYLRYAMQSYKDGRRKNLLDNYGREARDRLTLTTSRRWSITTPATSRS